MDQKGYAVEEQSSSLKKRIYKLLTYWTRLTWGEHVKITNKSLIPIHNQNKTITYEINPSMFRSLKISQCLKGGTTLMKMEKNFLLQKN